MISQCIYQMFRLNCSMTVIAGRIPFVYDNDTFVAVWAVDLDLRSGVVTYAARHRFDLIVDFILRDGSLETAGAAIRRFSASLARSIQLGLERLELGAQILSVLFIERSACDISSRKSLK